MEGSSHSEKFVDIQLQIEDPTYNTNVNLIAQKVILNIQKELIYLKTQ